MADAETPVESRGGAAARKANARELEKRKRAVILKNIPFADADTKRKYLYRAVRQGDLELVKLLLDKPEPRQPVAQPSSVLADVKETNGETATDDPQMEATAAGSNSRQSNKRVSFTIDDPNSNPSDDQTGNAKQKNAEPQVASTAVDESQDGVSATGAGRVSQMERQASFTSTSTIDLTQYMKQRPDNSFMIDTRWYGENLLIAAIKSGQSEVAKYLISKGIETNFRFLSADLHGARPHFFSTSCRQMAYSNGLFDLVEQIDGLEKEAELQREADRIRRYWQAALPITELDPRVQRRRRLMTVRASMSRRPHLSPISLPEPLLRGRRARSDLSVDVDVDSQTLTSSRSLPSLSNLRLNGSSRNNSVNAMRTSRPQSRTNKTAAIRSARSNRLHLQPDST